TPACRWRSTLRRAAACRSADSRTAADYARAHTSGQPALARRLVAWACNAGSSAVGSTSCTPFARTPRTSLEARRPRPASGKGSPVSLRDVLEHLVVEREIGHQVLQSAVLVLQLLEALGLLGLHAAVLVAPAIEGRLAHFQSLEHGR